MHKSRKQFFGRDVSKVSLLNLFRLCLGLLLKLDLSKRILIHSRAGDSGSVMITAKTLSGLYLLIYSSSFISLANVDAPSSVRSVITACDDNHCNVQVREN